MINLLKGIYLSALFKLNSNKEITIKFGKTLQPQYTTFYSSIENETIIVPKENIITDSIEKSSSSQNKEFKSSSTHKIDKMIFHGREIILPTTQTAIHILEYSNNDEYYKIFEKYADFLFDPQICKILLDNITYKRILQYLTENPSEITVEIKKMEPCWLQVLLPIVLMIAACSIYFVGSMFIKKLSKLDPVFSDFHISYSNLTKFKNLADSSMTQCTICFEDFSPEDDVRILRCLHYYHPTCIDRWLIGHSKKCPCCRHPVEVNEKY